MIACAQMFLEVVAAASVGEKNGRALLDPQPFLRKLGFTRSNGEATR